MNWKKRKTACFGLLAALALAICPMTPDHVRADDNQPPAQTVPEPDLADLPESQTVDDPGAVLDEAPNGEDDSNSADQTSIPDQPDAQPEEAVTDSSDQEAGGIPDQEPEQPVPDTDSVQDEQPCADDLTEKKKEESDSDSDQTAENDSSSENPESSDPNKDESEKTSEEGSVQEIEFRTKTENFEVVVKTANDILPSDAVMEVKEVVKNDPDYSLALSVLGQKETDSDALKALNVSFSHENTRIEPAGALSVTVTAFNINTSEIAGGAVELYQLKDQTMIKVETDPAALPGNAAAEVQDGTIHASFRTNSSATFVLNWQKAGQEPAADDSRKDQENNLTADQPRKKVSSQAESRAAGQYSLYTYTLIPGQSPDGNPTPPDKTWNGMGVYSITAPKAPGDQTHNFETMPYNDLEQNGYKVLLEGASYPDINVGGVFYHYDPNGNDARSYQIEWFRLVRADGANKGSNGYNTVASGMTYHLDGYLVLREEARITVDFKVLPPESSSFQPLGIKDGSEAFVQRINKRTAEKNITQPTADNSTYQETIKKDGITYHFDGWYRDEQFKQKCQWGDQELNDNQTYYGRYIPQTRTLTVANTVTGNLGDRKHPFEYTLQFFNKDGSPVNKDGSPVNEDILAGQSHGMTYSKDGVYSFTLKHTQTIAIVNVPSNLTYRITQTDGQDHQTSAKNGRVGESYDSASQSHSHDLKEDTTVQFFNDKKAVVPTGLHDSDKGSDVLIFYGGTGVLLMFAYAAMRRRSIDEI